MARISWNKLLKDGEIAFRLHEAGVTYRTVGLVMEISTMTAWRRANWWAEVQERAELLGRRPARSRDWLPMRHSAHGRRPPGSSGAWLSAEEWGGPTYHQGLAAQGYKPLDGRWYSPKEYPVALAERRARLLAEARAKN